MVETRAVNRAVFRACCIQIDAAVVRRRVGTPVGDDDDDDDVVVSGQAAAAAQQVLQRTRAVATSERRQEPARRLQHRAGRAEGGRDAGAEVRQLAHRAQRTLRRTPGLDQ